MALPKTSGTGSTALKNALLKNTNSQTLAPKLTPAAPPPPAPTIPQRNAAPPAPTKVDTSANNIKWLQSVAASGTSGNQAWANNQLNLARAQGATIPSNQPATSGGFRDVQNTPAPSGGGGGGSSYNATQAVKNAVAAITSGNAPAKAPVMQNAPVINKPIAQTPKPVTIANKPSASNPRLQGMPSNLSAARINATQTAAQTAAQRRSDLSTALFGEEYYPEAVRKGGIPAMVAYDLSGAIPGVGTGQAGAKAASGAQLGAIDAWSAIPFVGGFSKPVKVAKTALTNFDEIIKLGKNALTNDAISDAGKAIIQNLDRFAATGKLTGIPDIDGVLTSLRDTGKVNPQLLKDLDAVGQLADGTSAKLVQNAMQGRTVTGAVTNMPPPASAAKAAPTTINDTLRTIIGGGDSGNKNLNDAIRSVMKGSPLKDLTASQRGAINTLYGGKMPTDAQLKKQLRGLVTEPTTAKGATQAVEGVAQVGETAAQDAAGRFSSLLKGEIPADNAVLTQAIKNINEGKTLRGMSKTQVQALKDAISPYMKEGEIFNQAFINSLKTTPELVKDVVGKTGKVAVDDAGETVVNIADIKIGGVEGASTTTSKASAGEIADKINKMRRPTSGPDTTATRTTAYSGRTGDNVVRQPDTGGMRVDPRTGKVSWQNPTNPKFKGGEWVAGTPKLGDALRGADAGAATKAALAGTGIAGAVGAYNYFQQNPLDIQFGADAATTDAQTYEQQVLTEFGLLEPTTTTDTTVTADALSSAAPYAAPMMMSAAAGTGTGATSYGGGTAAGTGATTSGGGYTAAGAAQETGAIERDYYVSDPNGGWTQMTGYLGPDGLMYTDAGLTTRIPEYAFVPKTNADGSYARDENGMATGWQLIGGQGVPTSETALQMPEFAPEIPPEEVPLPEEEAQMSVFDEIMAQLEPYIQSQYAAVDAETEANIQRMREELAARGILNSDLVVSMEMDLRDQGEAQKDEIYAGIVKDAMTQAYQYAALEQDQTQFQQTYDQTERNNAARLEAEYAAIESDERRWTAQNGIDLAKLDMEERRLELEIMQARTKASGSSSKAADQYTEIADAIMTAAETAIFNGITDPAVIKSYMNNAAARFPSIPAGLMQSLQVNVANTLINQNRVGQ